MRASATTANLARPRGVALIAGLLLMSSMLILALAVGTGMLLERRMSANFADTQLALQRARLAQAWGEYWLLSRVADPLDPGCANDCGPTPPIFNNGQLPTDPEFQNGEWWQLNASAAGTDPVSGQVHMDYAISGTETPLWLIENLHSRLLQAMPAQPGASEPVLGYYRILGRGTGRYPGSVAVAESIVARPWIETAVPAPFPPGVESPWFCAQFSADMPCGRLGWRRRR